MSHIVGPAQMGNADVGNPNMAAAIQADQERWAAILATAEAKVSDAAQAVLDGTNDKGEDPGVPKPAKVLTVEEITERLIAQDLINLKRQPTDHRFATLTFADSTTPRQIVGRRVLRDTVVLFGGSAAVTLYVSRDDVGQAGAQITLGASGNANSVITLEDEAPIWGLAASAGVTIEIIETFYDPRRYAAAVAEIANAIRTGRIKQQVS